MKTSILGIVLFSLSFRLFAQTPPGCTAPAAVRAYYLNDAKQMAIHLMENDPQWQDSVIVPQALYQPILEALLAVYNAKDIPERDTVMECLDIHTFPLPFPNRLRVAANSQETWAKNLENGIFPSGSAQIDALMLQYQLAVANHFAIGNTIYFEMQSQDYLNQKALAQLFEGIQGVAFAETDSPYGDGNDIEYKWLLEEATLSFSYNWGDCPAGCIFSRKWTFMIDGDCKVSLLSVTGDKLDASAACSNTFACATNPLCMPWLQDTLAYYSSLQQGNCDTPLTGLYLSIKAQPSAQTVFILREALGIDAENFYFYHCDGEKVGACHITIAGIHCSSPSLIEQLNGTEIWNCASPLPTPQNCGTSPAREIAKKEIAFSIVPNPNYGSASLNFGDNSLNNCHISILDLQGKLLSEESVSELNTHLLDTSHLQTGIYLVRVESTEGVALQKMMVEK